MKRLEAALSALEDIAAASTDDKQLLIVTKCRALIGGYHAKWRDTPYQVDAVECLVMSDLWNPETQRKSRSFRMAGLLDVTGYAGRRVIFDHKTTSEDITDPAAPYWRQLVIEGQVNHYSLLEWLNGRKVDECVWDVMRKPSISPRKLESKKETTDTLASGRYYGRPLSNHSLAYLRESGRESHEMYEARLFTDCTAVRPEWYFQRRTTPRLDAEIHEYAMELWGHSQDILIARRENRWPRNSGACMLYKSPCNFLGICSGHDTPDSDNWTRKQNVHTELPILDGSDGRDLLTNSRIRCFQTCRRKHFYQYELGIERQNEEEREALLFGHIWHKALESYFLASMEVKCQDSSEVTEVTAKTGENNVNDDAIGSTGSELATAAAITQTVPLGDYREG